MNIDNLTIIFLVVAILVVLNLIKILCWTDLGLNECGCKNK